MTLILIVIDVIKGASVDEGSDFEIEIGIGGFLGCRGSFAVKVDLDVIKMIALGPIEVKHFTGQIGRAETLLIVDGGDAIIDRDAIEKLMAVVGGLDEQKHLAVGQYRRTVVGIDNRVARLGGVAGMCPTVGCKVTLVGQS